jgi:P-loop containing dynein motor region D4
VPHGFHTDKKLDVPRHNVHGVMTWHATVAPCASYGMAEFRQDMKKWFRVAGMEGKPVSLIFRESQAADELFFEDISSILSAGEVPGVCDTRHAPVPAITLTNRMHLVLNGMRNRIWGPFFGSH